MNTISSERILSHICKHFKTKPRYFLTPTRGQAKRAFIRQAYIHLLWTYTGLTQPEIGELTGRDRTSVNCTLRMVKNRCSVDGDFRKSIIELENMIE